MLVTNRKAEGARRAGLALVFVALLFGTSACGGANVESTEPVQETQLAPEQPAAGDSSGGAGQAAASPPPATGTILRKDLQQVLSAGPAGVLAMVKTEPARTEGRFIGFKITSFVSGNPRAIDLRPGDILVAVNGKKIVSPDDYFRVFQELLVASELRFDIIRDGATLALSYQIVD